MSGLVRHLVAGALASLAAVLVIVADRALGLTPRFDLIGLIAGMIQRFAGVRTGMAAGWAVHATVGTLVWPLIYAGAAPLLAKVGGLDRPILRGVVFALIPGIGIAIVLGLLASAFDVPRPVVVALVVLALHAVYGVVLGALDRG